MKIELRVNKKCLPSHGLADLKLTKSTRKKKKKQTQAQRIQN